MIVLLNFGKIICCCVPRTINVLSVKLAGLFL